MTSVLQSQLKGNYGAYLVATILSKKCLVRPVTEGTDVGIDLFCESITPEGRPFQHFWVQVKTRQFEVRDGMASYDFERKHLEYWARQPVPVFAFLVPFSGEFSAQPREIFIVNLSEWLLLNGVPKENFKRIFSFRERTLSVNSDADLDWFFYQHVPAQTAALKIREGLIAPAEDPQGPQYERHFYMPVYGPEHAEKAFRAMQATAAFGSIALMQGDMSSNQSANRRHWECFISLLRVLEEWKQGYENHLAFGCAALLNGNLEEARSRKNDALGGPSGHRDVSPEFNQRVKEWVEKLMPESELQK